MSAWPAAISADQTGTNFNRYARRSCDPTDTRAVCPALRGRDLRPGSDGSPPGTRFARRNPRQRRGIHGTDSPHASAEHKAPGNSESRTVEQETQLISSAYAIIKRRSTHQSPSHHARQQRTDPCDLPPAAAKPRRQTSAPISIPRLNIAAPNNTTPTHQLTGMRPSKS